VGPGPEMVTDVAAPLFVKIALSLPLGTPTGFQFVSWFHSCGFGSGPTQVLSFACAVFGVASAPRQTLPSSAARPSADGAEVVAIRIALSRTAAHGAAARVACERHRYERIPQPLRAAPAAFPHHRPRRPARTNNRPAANATGGTGNDQFAMARLGADCRRVWLFRHAAPPDGVCCAREGVGNDLTRVTRIFQRM
jgi:hypothetical protein